MVSLRSGSVAAGCIESLRVFVSSGDVEVRVGICLDTLLSDYRLSLHVGLCKNRVAHLGGQKKR